MEKIKQVIVPRKWEAFVRVSGTEDDWKVWTDEIDFYAVMENEKGDTRIAPAVSENGTYVYSIMDNVDDILDKLYFGNYGYPTPLELRELYEDDVAEWFKKRRNN